MAAQQYIQHVTVDGERWDLIAWNYYGDASLFSPIIFANPSVPIEPVFEPGIVILVPLLEQASVTPPQDLPPWETL
jgi:phage tail protein X